MMGRLLQFYRTVSLNDVQKDVCMHQLYQAYTVEQRSDCVGMGWCGTDQTRLTWIGDDQLKKPKKNKATLSSVFT